MATFGELTRQFNKAFALPSEESFTIHDGGHVMTGCGIGLAEELRVAAMEDALWDRRTLELAFDHQRNVFKHTMAWYKNKGSMNIEEGGLDKVQFQKLQLRTVPLAREEVVELYGLGLDILKAFREVTGARYKGFGSGNLLRLNLQGLDFTQRVVDIKAAFETSENADVAEKSARLLHYASIRKGGGRQVIPAAGLPWHGPLMKPFR